MLDDEINFISFAGISEGKLVVCHTESMYAFSSTKIQFSNILPYSFIVSQGTDSLAAALAISTSKK